MRHGMTTARGLCGSAVVAVALVFGSSRIAAAQHETLLVSGSPAPMRVQTAVAGSVLVPVVDNSTTYTYTSQGDGNRKKITAQLNAPMPDGVTLQATFDSPDRASSIPDVVLDATARDVVTDLPFTHGSAVTMGITYTLTATPAAGIVPAQSRTVTLTIIRAP